MIYLSLPGALNCYAAGFVKGRISIGGNGRSGQLRPIQARHAIRKHSVSSVLHQR